MHMEGGGGGGGGQAQVATYMFNHVLIMPTLPFPLSYHALMAPSLMQQIDR